MLRAPVDVAMLCAPVDFSVLRTPVDVLTASRSEPFSQNPIVWGQR